MLHNMQITKLVRSSYCMFCFILLILCYIQDERQLLFRQADHCFYDGDKSTLYTERGDDITNGRISYSNFTSK